MLHFVEYLFRDGELTRTAIEEVFDRKVDLEKVPKNVFGYRFFDREEIQGEDGTSVLGPRENESGTTFLGKRVYTLEEVKSDFPNLNGIITFMTYNRCPNVVLTKMGNWQPFKIGDFLIEV